MNMNHHIHHCLNWLLRRLDKIFGSELTTDLMQLKPNHHSYLWPRMLIFIAGIVCGAILTHLFERETINHHELELSRQLRELEQVRLTALETAHRATARYEDIRQEQWQRVAEQEARRQAEETTARRAAAERERIDREQRQQAAEQETRRQAEETTARRAAAERERIDREQRQQAAEQETRRQAEETTARRAAAERERIDREQRQQAAEQEARRQAEEATRRTSNNEITTSLNSIQDGRFFVYGNGMIRDSSTRLIWAAADNQEDINWFQASHYVEKLRLGGYSDWRLPTVNELEQLFQTGNNNRPPSLGCSGGYRIVNSFHLSCGVLWSADRKNDGAYALNFISGKPQYDNPSGGGRRRVLPVRSD